MPRIRWPAILLAVAALLSVLSARSAATESLASPAPSAPARVPPGGGPRLFLPLNLR